MNQTIAVLSLLLLNLLLSCTSTKNPETGTVKNNNSSKEDRISISFAFIGCNRIAYNDRDESNASKANVPALKRIFNELSKMDRKPDLLFFLGDLVLGEKDTTALNTQLQAWTDQYEDVGFSLIANSGIELVALPGNHEMLFYDEETGGEFPLKGATEDWLKHMEKYIPKDRNKMKTNPIINGATFSFVRDSIAFIVMNTDTYNDPSPGEKYGKEGQVPYEWINQEIIKHSQSPAIKNVFTLGHRPYYVDGQFDTLHGGFPDGPKVWPTMVEQKVVALLTAHQHKYQRWQPEGKGTYEIIAGQGGTYSGENTPQFYGYSIINVYEDNKIVLITKGWDLPNPTWDAAPNNPTTLRDSTILIPMANKNPYAGN